MLQRPLSVEQLCRKLKPIFGKKIDDIYLKYAMAETREAKEEIVHILNVLYQKNLGELLERRVLLEPPSEEAMDGTYNLAAVSYAGKKLFQFNLREKDWPRHVCISGMSGSGKTTLAFNIISNLIQHDKPFLVFDWKKSFRPLLLTDVEVLNFTIGNDSVSNMFKMNINKPPKGVNPKEWINVLCDLLTESFFVSFGVHKVLLETLDEAFKEWGIYEGSENYPTWNHIKWYLEEKFEKSKGREAGWVESALRIASILTFGSFGDICNYKEEDSLSVEDLLNKKVIFELNSLSNIEKKFFCEFVLTYIYKLKKAQQKSSDGKFEHAILVDEAHNIFLKSPTHFAKESVTDMIYREMREYGTSLICLDQHISKLSDTVKGNSACNIAFQQQLPADIYDISGLMQLKEQRNFFSMLPVGSAIVKLSERYASPFLIEVSPVEIRNNDVSDAKVKSRAQAFLRGIEDEIDREKELKKKLLEQKPVGIGEVTPDTIKIRKPEKIEDKSSEEEKVREIFEKPTEVHEKKPEEKEPSHTLIEARGKPVNERIEKRAIENSPARILNEESFMTPVQKVLYEFVEEKVKEGRELKELDNLLEEHKDEGGYTLSDIATVINHVLKNHMEDEEFSEAPAFSENVTTFEKQKAYKVDNFSKERDLGREQKRFLVFLQDNQDKDYGTVNIYKSLGLSSRKGNKIKNELLNKNMIRIQEKKNDKGWKKIIQLTPSIHIH